MARCGHGPKFYPFWQLLLWDHQFYFIVNIVHFSTESFGRTSSKQRQGGGGWPRESRPSHNFLGVYSPLKSCKSHIVFELKYVHITVNTTLSARKYKGARGRGFKKLQCNLLDCKIPDDSVKCSSLTEIVLSQRNASEHFFRLNL